MCRGFGTIAAEGLLAVEKGDLPQNLQPGELNGLTAVGQYKPKAAGTATGTSDRDLNEATGLVVVTKTPEHALVPDTVSHYPSCFISRSSISSTVLLWFGA